MDWIRIINQDDMDYLMSEYNGFHDSCIYSAYYISGAMVDEEDCMKWERDDCVLVLKFDSQSPPHDDEFYKKSIELKFIGLRRINLIGYRDNYFCEILSCHLSFYDGFIVWADDDSFDPNNVDTTTLYDETMHSFVVANRLEWRFA
ncbi:MAG: hypothetical protein FWH01_14405 [Oscillospiraceae bacterium]|nr:hypothetical protein [Oscillospiraceae bacterium]